MFVHKAPTKIKRVKPRAKHVQVASLVKPVLAVVHSMTRVVQKVPIPVILRPFVIYVVLVNIMTKQAKYLNQLLVKVAMRENIKTKRGNHRVNYVPVVRTALMARPIVNILQLLALLEHMPVVQQCVNNVLVVHTALLVHQVVCIMNLLVLLELMPLVQHVNHVPVASITTNLAKALVKVAMLENTKTKREKHRATAIVLVLK